jgi:uridine phosphorylase
MCSGIQNTLEYAEDLNPVATTFVEKMKEAEKKSTWNKAVEPRSLPTANEVWGPRIGGVFNHTLMAAFVDHNVGSKEGKIENHFNVIHAVIDELAKRGVAVYTTSDTAHRNACWRDIYPPDKYPQLAYDVVVNKVTYTSGDRNANMRDRTMSNRDSFFEKNEYNKKRHEQLDHQYMLHASLFWTIIDRLEAEAHKGHEKVKDEAQRRRDKIREEQETQEEAEAGRGHVLLKRKAKKDARATGGGRASGRGRALGSGRGKIRTPRF